MPALLALAPVPALVAALLAPAGTVLVLPEPPFRMTLTLDAPGAMLLGAAALLLTGAVAEGQWWWALVVLVGGLLAGGYVFLVLVRALGDPIEPLRLSAQVSRRRQAVVAVVALCAILLGFVPLRPLGFLQIGRTDTAIVRIR